MKALSFLMALSLFVFSCERNNEDVPVTMEYINLENAEVYHNHNLDIDLDKDGIKDFYVTTQFISYTEDDRIQYIITPRNDNRSLLEHGNVPKAFEQDAIISKNSPSPYLWASGNALLIERVVPLDIAKSYWEGAWKDKMSKYLAVQVNKDEKLYNGWIRISVSPTYSRLIIHDAAISKTPDVGIKAGQK